MESLGENNNIKQSSSFNKYIITSAIIVLLSTTTDVLAQKKQPAKPIKSIEQTSQHIIMLSIKNTLGTIKTLKDLPKTINYPNTIIDGPKTIDIIPKKIITPIQGITIILGDRKFYIEPKLGLIEGISRTTNGLIIKTSYINREYSKEEKLPSLCFKLWSTTKEKGEKTGFIGTKIIEI